MKITHKFSPLDVIDIQAQVALIPNPDKVIQRLAKEYDCDQQFIYQLLQARVDVNKLPKRGITIAIIKPHDTTIKDETHSKSKHSISAARQYETRQMSNGELATIIVYRSALDIDVEFADGTIRQHVEYSHFKAGLIGKKARKKRKTSATEQTKTSTAGTDENNSLSMYPDS